MALLTDRTLATGVTLSDYIHVVIPSDISQNPAGSSYKATVSQVADVFSNLFVNQSGDTMTGTLIVPTISATTYQNLPVDPDTYVTGYTYSSNTFTIKQNDGQPDLTSTINSVTSLTVNGNLTVTGNTSLQSTTASTLNISSTPTTDTNLPANYLTRDSTTGEVKVKTIPGPTVYGLFAQTGNSVTATATTQTSLIDGGVGSLSVPANGFSVGDSFRADFGGLISVKPGGDTIRIRVTSNAGAITLADTGNLSVAAINPADVWNLVLNFTVRQIGGPGTASIVTLGNLHVVKTSSGTPYSYGFNVVNQSTFNTTISNQLDVTVAWGSTNAANTMYSDIFVLNKIY